MYNKYYYLVASLPYLLLGKISPIGAKEFLTECRKWLSPPDFNKLESADINDFENKKDDLPLLRKWKSFDLTLRTELAEFRIKKRKDKDQPVPAGLKDIFEHKDPLSMEEAISKKRWDFIEECELGNHFDLNFLTLYFLKLQILERIARFDKEKGKRTFEDICEVKYE